VPCDDARCPVLRCVMFRCERGFREDFSVLFADLHPVETRREKECITFAQYLTGIAIIASVWTELQTSAEELKYAAHSLPCDSHKNIGLYNGGVSDLDKNATR